MPIDQRLEISIQPDISRLNVRRLAAPRNVLLALLVAASVFTFLTPLRDLLTLCMGSAEYSYIVLIPVMVLGLFYLERGKIFQRVHYSLGVGMLVILAGVAMAGAGVILSSQLSADSRLFLEILGLVIIWIGGFVLCYGAEASRAGLFALLFTLLLVPLPHILMAKPIAVIQHGSADVTGILFTLAGLPVFRNGLTFSLPRLTFVVATECSGIHSTTALFIATILVGHFYLKSGWEKGLLVLLVFPIISFTNGLRMFILATLAAYVDMSFFYGNLHRKGGTLFFGLALVILALVTRLLRRRLRARSAAQPAQGGAPGAPRP